MLGYPPCFASRAAFDSWKQKEKEGGPANLSGFCHDCTPRYKAAMEAAARCNYPEVVFVELIDDEDGEMEPERYVAGVRP